MIKINDTDISGVYVGSQSASSIYLGSTQIWSAGGGGGYDLPNVPYLCNYNAKDFDDTTQTFYRSKNNQLFQQDLTRTYGNSNLTLDGNKVAFDGGWYSQLNFENVSSNPFNRTSADTTYTAIYKTSSFANSLLGNRFGNQNYNYMIRNNIFHTSDGNFLNFTASSYPATFVIRVDSQGNAERKWIEGSQSATDTIVWGNISQGMGFFCGRGDAHLEAFKGDFYWLYISNNYLTDSQVQQVIDYNNNK